MRKNNFIILSLLTLLLMISSSSWGINRPSVRLVRNATLILNYAGKKILVDPMLTAKGTLEPRAGGEWNPLVELPMPVSEIVKEVDWVLVTHTHRDHFDDVASANLDKSVKLTGQPADSAFFKKEGFRNTEMLVESAVWEGIRITRTEAKHGSGEVLKLMGKASGFVLQAENQPTVYIIGDAIWTDEIRRNIDTFKPDYIVVNSGGAVFVKADNSLIIMDEEQVMTLLQNSGKAKVIAVHMDALDHCRTSRQLLKQKAEEAKVENGKLLIPADGEIVFFKNNF